MSAREWKLRCLQCDHEETDLVAMQEHLIQMHGVPQESFRTQQRETVEHYRWRLPDGTPLMDAVGQVRSALSPSGHPLRYHQ
jgi:hypothetical protein